MNKRRALLGLLFLVHAAISARAMLDTSYVDLFKFAFSDWPARQIFSDLTVCMLIITSWMVRDARKTGRNAWPYVIAAFFVGSFAPLAYLLLAPTASTPPHGASDG